MALKRRPISVAITSIVRKIASGESEEKLKEAFGAHIAALEVVPLLGCTQGA